MALGSGSDRARWWPSVLVLLAAGILVIAVAVAVIATSMAPVTTAVPATDERPEGVDHPASVGSTSDGWAVRLGGPEVAVVPVAERRLRDDRAVETVDEPADPPTARRREEPGETIQERGAAARSRIDYPWHDLGFEIHFLPPRRGLRGMTFPEERRIELYVRLGDPLARTAHDLAHEIGHAVDIVHMTSTRRSEWAERRGFDESTPWWPCARCEDRGTGSGDYAEVFALWQVGGRYFSSQLAPAPSREELAELVAYFSSPTSERDRRDEDDDRSPLIPCVVSCR